jgi:hypothetical protein
MGRVTFMTPIDDGAQQALPDESVDSETIASRAGGRPPEEGSSDDPEAQAKAILEESEERIRASDPQPREG